MPKYVLRVHYYDSLITPVEMPGNTEPMNAITAAHHYVDSGQAVYVEVLSVGFTGVGRLLGTAGRKPNV